MSTLLFPNMDRESIVPSPGKKCMRNVTGKITEKIISFPSLSHAHRREGHMEH